MCSSLRAVLTICHLLQLLFHCIRHITPGPPSRMTSNRVAFPVAGNPEITMTGPYFQYWSKPHIFRSDYEYTVKSGMDDCALFNETWQPACLERILQRWSRGRIIPEVGTMWTICSMAFSSPILQPPVSRRPFPEKAVSTGVATRPLPPKLCLFFYKLT